MLDRAVNMCVLFTFKARLRSSYILGSMAEREQPQMDTIRPAPPGLKASVWKHFGRQGPRCMQVVTLLFLFMLVLCNAGKYVAKCNLPVDTSLPFVSTIVLINDNGSKCICCLWTITNTLCFKNSKYSHSEKK